MSSGRFHPKRTDTIALFDNSSDEAVARWPLSDAQGQVVAFSADDKTLYVLATRKDAVFAFDVEKRVAIAEHRFGPNAAVSRTLSVTAAGILVRLGTEVQRLNARTLAVEATAVIEGHHAAFSWSAFAASPAGDRMAVAIVEQGKGEWLYGAALARTRDGVSFAGSRIRSLVRRRNSWHGTSPERA